MTQGRVFLSAVSSEFDQERRELRHDFGTRGMQVAIQEELSHLTGASTLLELLDNHMRDCAGAVFRTVTRGNQELRRPARAGGQEH